MIAVQDYTSKEPLVSVIVVTYNSSNSIIETLDSIYQQSYLNIELIITDDYSKDNTNDRCQKWLEKNGNRFLQTKFISGPRNTGISMNCNRGLSACSGDWVKMIAGDDKIEKNCLKSNVDFVKKSKQICVVISQYEMYKDKFISENLIGIRPPENLLPFFEMKVEDQYDEMIINSYALILGLFIKRDVLTKLGGFDERFKNIEDLPILIKLLENGHKFYFLKKVTAYYRISSSSISSQRSINYKFMLSDLFKIYLKLRRPRLTFSYKMHYDLHFIGEYMNTYIFRYWNFEFGQKISRMLLQLSPIQHKIRLKARNNFNNSNKTKFK